jgi:hypothetical protein
VHAYGILEDGGGSLEIFWNTSGGPQTISLQNTALDKRGDTEFQCSCHVNLLIYIQKDEMDGVGSVYEGISYINISEQKTSRKDATFRDLSVDGRILKWISQK